MHRNVPQVVAIVLGSLLTVVATSWAVVAAHDQDALQVDELLRVEALPDPDSVLDEQLRRVFQSFGGNRPWTAEEYDTRFSESFRTAIDLESLNEGLTQLIDDFGAVGFVRVLEQEPDFVRALAVAERGPPLVAVIGLDEDGRMRTMGLDALPSPSRQPGWALGLAVVVAVLFLAAAIAAVRTGEGSLLWPFVGGMLVSLASLLVVADLDLAYTVGRVAPAAAVALAAWLLVEGCGRTARRWVLAGAAFAALGAAGAPLVRDAALVGHPDVLGSFADDDSAYRALLAAGAALGAGAMIVVAAQTRARADASGRRRPPRVAVAAIASIWAVSQLGSALDAALGDGALIGGLLGVTTWVAFGSVAAIWAYGLISPRWDSSELASLVIDLEAEGSELRPAVARALEDPSLQILTSEDGETLLDEAGAPFSPDDPPSGRTLTQIRSQGTLVGALVHDAALQPHADRLRAVAAATGLALEVSRLNRQVCTQLDDVVASRTRIVEASDAARRRVERDLHDGAQQRLVAVGVTLQRARRLAATTGSELEVELLDAAAHELREVLDDIRSVSRGSSPPLLAERGLAAAVDALVERAPVPVRVEITTEQLNPTVAAAVYFVVAEALTNIAKHSKASAATVVIGHEDGAARVAVSDDGAGGAVITPGSGLQGLDDRVAATGGSFIVHSGPCGTTLEASIPCE